MFYDGDLQSGIALALRESKFVACFVQGNDEQSSVWGEDYLKDAQVTTALTAKAVTLRIGYGSQEAGFLSAYYPVPVVPALIIIHNGQLVLHLQAGVAKDHMKAEILKTLSNTSLSNAPRTEVGSSTTPDPSTSQHSTSRPQQTTVTESLIPQHNSAQANMDSASLVPTNSMTVANSDEDAPATTSLTSSSREPSQTVQNLLADRRRLEIDKTEKDAAEKAERLAKAEARRQAINAVPDSAKAKQAKYAQQQRKRQQEAKLERERIVRQIEHDKAERREKEERRRALARAEVEGKDGADGLVDQQLFDEVNAPQSMNSNACAVQVRLFDGSTIRNKFPSNQTLRTNVRGWLDEQRSDGDIPYTFKQILSPLPNRTLSISEEEESLQSLGLSPSATLVMVPVQGYIAAYGGNQGIVSRGASVGYSVVSAGAGLVTGALGTVLGLGRAAPQDVREANAAEGALEGSEPKANGSGSSFRTLQDQREDRQDHQLYNGNHLNFEPRRDERDEDE